MYKMPFLMQLSIKSVIFPQVMRPTPCLSSFMPHSGMSYIMFFYCDVLLAVYCFTQCVMNVLSFSLCCLVSCVVI